MDTVARIVTNGIRASGAILTRVACTLVNVSRAIFPFPANRAIAEVVTNYVQAFAAIVEHLLVYRFVRAYFLGFWYCAQHQVRLAIAPWEQPLRHLRKVRNVKLGR